MRGADERTQRVPGEPRSARAVVAFVLGAALAAALVLLVAQNTQEVEFQWTVWEVRAPLAAMILGAMLVAVVVGELTAVAVRRRRRRARERLRELAAGQSPAAEAGPASASGGDRPDPEAPETTRG